MLQHLLSDHNNLSKDLVCFHYKLGLDEEERVSRVKVIFLLCTKSIKLLLSGNEELRKKQINPKYQHSKLHVVFIWQFKNNLVVRYLGCFFMILHLRGVSIWSGALVFLLIYTREVLIQFSN